MDLDEYQTAAARTDQQAGDSDRSLMVALLGLAGEVGTLLTERKKWLRDGDAHDNYGHGGDIGDILWYLAAASSALGVGLNPCGCLQLVESGNRWPRTDRAGIDATRAPTWNT
jgi:hypothetical protein